MGCLSSIAPIAGAAIGGYFGGPAGAAIGGQIGGQIGGGLEQAGAAGEAAEALEPFVGLGTSAASNLRGALFGQDGADVFRRSPEFELSQDAIRRASRDAGFALSARGQNPFGADSSIASGAGLQAFLQAANNASLANFDRFANRRAGLASLGAQAAGAQIAPTVAQGSALGGTIAGAGTGIGKLFGEGGPFAGGTTGGISGGGPASTVTTGGTFGGFPLTSSPTFGFT